MNINKSLPYAATALASESELEAINAFAKRTLKAEEVYTFAVKLCDNEVDRDFERFSDGCLEELRELFVGKSGILDHEWSANKQLARIYRTEVIAESGRKNAAGEDYRYLKGWAYMLKSEATAPFIEAIEAGIVKETSVGCAVSRRLCSICDEEHCEHLPGNEYGGQLCHNVLFDAVDAYEWSFVAVPAQREAGVMKGSYRGSLSDFVKTQKGAAFAGELKELKRLAAEGAALLEGERGEIYRLSLLWDEQMTPSIKKAAEHMGAEELKGLRESLEKKLSGNFPPLCQLPGKNRDLRFDGDDYII